MVRIQWLVMTLALLLAAALTAAVAQGGEPLVRLPTVAVMPFDDAVIGSDCGWTWNARRWSPGAGVADLITTELACEADRQRTFRVVERERLFEVLAEQDLGTGGRLDTATAASIGRILGADLLLMGGVTRFDVSSDYVGLPWRAGFDAERHVATVAFDGRLVDSTTAAIVAQGRGRGSETRYGATITRGSFAGLDFGSTQFGTSLLGVAARKAACSLARGISREIDQMVGPAGEWLAEADALVVYCEERDGAWWPMINRGGRDGVHVGDQLVIKRRLQDIHDPLTGELLKTIWLELGVMTVREVEEKVASGPMPRPVQDGDRPAVGDIAVILKRN